MLHTLLRCWQTNQVGSVLTRGISNKAQLPSVLCNSLDSQGDEKKVFRRLLDLSFKWRIPSNEMKRMANLIKHDATVLEEKGTVKKLVKNVVIQNICLLTEEEELFKKDYRGFIAQDLSESETRRSVALQLFKSMFSEKKNQKVKRISLAIINKLLYTRNQMDEVLPSRRWRDIDCGFRLATSLVESSLVFVQSFEDHYSSLLMHNVNYTSMVRAAALRMMISAARCGQISFELLDVLALNIGARNNVVHSYAATCIREIILEEQRRGEVVFARADLIVKLFKALDFNGSEDNEHILECLFVLIDFAHLGPEVDQFCLSGLVRRLHRDSNNHNFNRFLFLSLAVLLRRSDSTYLQAVAPYEDLRENKENLLRSATRVLCAEVLLDTTLVDAVITVVASSTQENLDGLTEKEVEPLYGLALLAREHFGRNHNFIFNNLSEANKDYLRKLSARYNLKFEP